MKSVLITCCSIHSYTEKTWYLLNFEVFSSSGLSLGDLHPYPVHLLMGRPWESFASMSFIVAASILQYIYCINVPRFPLAIKTLVISVTCLFGVMYLWEVEFWHRSIWLNAILALSKCLCSNWGICRSSQSLVTDTASCSLVHCLSSSWTYLHLLIHHLHLLLVTSQFSCSLTLWWLPFHLFLAGVPSARPHFAQFCSFTSFLSTQDLGWPVFLNLCSHLLFQLDWLQIAV